jgi:hypothetical protein
MYSMYLHVRPWSLPLSTGDTSKEKQTLHAHVGTALLGSVHRAGHGIWGAIKPLLLRYSNAGGTILLIS